LKDRFAGQRVKCRNCQRQFDVPGTAPEPIEYSIAGDSILRHQVSRSDPDFMPDATPFMEDIERHVARTIGPVSFVFHELISDVVHLDLLIVPPTGKEPTEEHPLGTDHFTIITMGMLSRPMTLRKTSDPDMRYAELIIALPADWPGLHPDGTFIDDEMQNENAWWPFRWLKNVARLPHEYATYIGPGHTIPNGDPPEPFADNTGFCCVMTWPPLMAPDSSRLVINDDIVINFYALWPMYAEEVDFKLKRGVDPLLAKYDEIELVEMIQVDRPNTCGRWF
jgi:hypothetical protein